MRIDPATISLARSRLEVAAQPLRSDGSWRAVDGIWSDSPDGYYPNGADSKLVTSLISLEGLKNCQVKFRARHRLEDSYDHLRVEAREPEGKWKEVGKFTGASEWDRHSLDLSSFDGGVVQLRFRVTSDPSRNDEGADIADILVGGKESFFSGFEARFDASKPHPLKARLPHYEERELLQLDRLTQASATLTEAEELRSQLGIRNEAELELAASLYPQLHSATSEGFEILRSGVDQPDADSRREALTLMNQTLGWEQTRSIWPQVEQRGPGEFADRARLALVAAKLDPEKAPQAYGRLATQNYDANQLLALEGLLDELSSWRPEGSWGRQGESWSDSPNTNYSSNSNSSITSRSLELGGRSAQVTFEARYGLESGYDKVFLESSVDGGAWATLEEFTGQSDWGGHKATLPAGKDVQVRFRLKSDSSREEMGFLFKDFKVRTGADRMSEGETHPRSGDVLELLAQGADPKVMKELLSRTGVSVGLELWPRLQEQQVQAQLALLDHLAGDKKEYRKAAVLWQALVAHLGEDDFQERRDAVETLAAEKSPHEALELATFLEQGFPGRFSEQVETFQVARSLARISRESVRELYLKLARSGLSQEERRRLAALAPHSKEFRPAGTWGEIEDGWSGSPGGVTPANASASLTSRVLDLSGWRSAALDFEARFSLENGYDRILLEASSDGQDWEELKSFTGDQEDWSRCKVSLPARLGPRPRVRFRQQHDGSRESSGFELRNFNVTGKRSWAQLFREPVNHPSEKASEVLNRFLDPSTSPAQRMERVDLATGLLQTDLDVESSLELAGQLKNPSLYPAETVARLAAGLGADEARSLLESGGLRAAEGVSLVKLFETRYQESGGTLPPESRAALLDADLQGETLGLIRRLSGRGIRQLWDSQGSWGPHPRVKGVWCDSPAGSYADKANDSLISAPLDLTGISRAQLRFQAQWRLEAGYDHVHVEASTDGQNWETLKSFTGDSERKDQKVDLSSFDGQRPRVRFRLQTDSSRSYDGFQFESFALHGHREGSWLPFIRQEISHSKTEGLDALVKLATEPGVSESVRNEAFQGLAALDEGSMLGALGLAHRLKEQGGLPFKTFSETVKALLETAVQTGSLQTAVGELQRLAQDADIEISEDTLTVGDFDVPIKD